MKYKTGQWKITLKAGGCLKQVSFRASFSVHCECYAATLLKRNVPCWSLVWNTFVMPYVKPSANRKLQIWLMDQCWWGQSSLTMCRLNLNLKILGEILVSHTGGGGQSSFTMSRQSHLFKVIGEILVKILNSRFSLHMVKDDWLPPVWQTSSSPRILKLRFSLHMLKDDWPLRNITDHSLRHNSKLKS